jgi:hypothetical protein
LPHERIIAEEMFRGPDHIAIRRTLSSIDLIGSASSKQHAGCLYTALPRAVNEFRNVYAIVHKANAGKGYHRALAYVQKSERHEQINISAQAAKRLDENPIGKIKGLR